MFVRSTHLRHQLTAFLPGTFRHRQQTRASGVHEYTLGAYWHDLRGGSRVAFGAVVLFLNPTSIPGDPLRLTYAEALQLAARTAPVPQGDSVTFAAAEKLGGGRRAYHNPELYAEVTPGWPHPAPYLREADYDAAALTALLTNPYELPPNADGWYRLQQRRE